MTLGLFAGALPVYGLPGLAVALAGVWFGLDVLLVWAASLADMPILFAAIRAAEARTGAAFGAPDWVGALPVGLALGLAGGCVSYVAARVFVREVRRAPYRLPESAPPWVAAVERAATRYGRPDSSRPWERAQFHRVRGKLLADPVTRILAALEGEAPLALGSLLDVGAGRGQLGVFLLELGRAASVRGIDWDRHKVEDAERAARPRPRAQGLDAIFAVADARVALLEPADTVLLIDLLHYFRPEEQDFLLDRAAAAVRPGGRILVREADPERGLRSWATRVEEGVFTLLRVHRGERVRFRAAVEIVQRLEGSGLTCETLNAWGGTPFSNVLIVGRRPLQPAPAPGPADLVQTAAT